MRQPARERAKIKLSALGDELIRPEQVLGRDPPFDWTADDVNVENDSYRATPEVIVSHRFLRAFSGTVSA